MFNIKTPIEKHSKISAKTIFEATEALRTILPQGITNDDVFIICIGTDRSTGDSLGPLTGTKLRELGYTNVIGTLEEPVHAMNLQEAIQSAPKDKIIIAIDACLGKSGSIENIDISKGPIKPGAGVDKDLPAVGDYSIAGIVNVGGFMEYFVLQNTRLSLVMKLSNIIVAALHNNLSQR